jgi:DNA repair protein RecO (recombination protein O)
VATSIPRAAIPHTALLLRLQPLGEADYIVSLLTLNAGRVDALARGARSSRRRFAGVLRPFCRVAAEVEPPRRGSLATLKSADLLEDLAGDALSYPQLCLAAYLSELALQVAQADHAEPALFHWLADRWPWCRQLADADLPAAKLAAEVAWLHVGGVLPDLLHCSRCSALLVSGGSWPADLDGLGCPDCLHAPRDWVPAASLAALVQAAHRSDLQTALALPPESRLTLDDRVRRLVGQTAPGQLRAEKALRDCIRLG